MGIGLAPLTVWSGFGRSVSSSIANPHSCNQTHVSWTLRDPGAIAPIGNHRVHGQRHAPRGAAWDERKVDAGGRFWGPTHSTAHGRSQDIEASGTPGWRRTSGDRAHFLPPILRRNRVRNATAWRKPMPASQTFRRKSRLGRSSFPTCLGSAPKPPLHRFIAQSGRGTPANRQTRPNLEDSSRSHTAP